MRIAKSESNESVSVEFDNGEIYHIFPDGVSLPALQGFEAYVNLEHGDELVYSSVALPKVGRWVRATLDDETVEEFEVLDIEEDEISFEIKSLDSMGTRFINKPGTKQIDKVPYLDIAKWEYIEKPIQWKVGNIVPTGREGAL